MRVRGADTMGKVTRNRYGERVLPKGKPMRARRNPAPRDEIAKAQQLHRDFSGHEATRGTKVRNPQLRTALSVGKVDGLMYTAKRDGKTLRYFHKFGSKSRPLLVANFDGSSVAIVGGRYRFTDRGIVDT